MCARAFVLACVFVRSRVCVCVYVRARAFVCVCVCVCVCPGIGLALTYAPSIITVGFYFEKFRGLASGISSAAAGVGILLGSVIMQFLIDEYSVEGAFLLAGAIAFHHCLFAMFYRPTVHERRNLNLTFKERSPIVTSTLSLNGVENGIKEPVPALSEKCVEANLKETEAQVPLLCEISPNSQTSDETRVESETEFETGDKVCGKIPSSDEQEQRANTLAIPAKEEGTVNRSFAIKIVDTDKQSSKSSSMQNLKDVKALQPNQISLPSSEGKSLGTGAKGHQPQALDKCNTDSPANQRELDKYCREFMQVIGNTAFMCYSLAQLMTMVSMMGVYLHLPEYVHTLGTSPTAAASLFIPLGLMR